MRRTSKGKAYLPDEYLASIFDLAEEYAAKYPKDIRDTKVKEYMDKAAKKLMPAIDNIADDMLRDAREDIRSALDEDVKYRKGFEARLYKTHKELFEKYHTLVEISLENVDKHRKSVYAVVSNGDNLFGLILRFHARIIRNAFEIGALARTGYGTGALARWRAMHETYVIMTFIRKYGDKAANAFIDYAVVSSFRASTDYQKYATQLGEEPFDDNELKDMQSERDKVVKKYGTVFGQENGWMKYLSKNKINNFRDVEKNTDLDHLRPYYRYSSLGIHSEFRSLTSGEEFEALNGSDPVNLVGAADYGFEDALRLSIITVGAASVEILNYHHSIDSLISMKIIQNLVTEALEEWEKTVASKRRDA